MRHDQLSFEQVESTAKSLGCTLQKDKLVAFLYRSGTHNVYQSAAPEDSTVYRLTLPSGNYEECFTLWEIADCLKAFADGRLK